MFLERPKTSTLDVGLRLLGSLQGEVREELKFLALASQIHPSKSVRQAAIYASRSLGLPILDNTPVCDIAGT